MAYVATKRESSFRTSKLSPQNLNKVKYKTRLTVACRANSNGSTGYRKSVEQGCVGVPIDPLTREDPKLQNEPT